MREYVARRQVGAQSPRGSHDHHRDLGHHRAARRVLDEIFPADDEAALAAAISPQFINHEAPPGTPPGLGTSTYFMHLLARAFSDQKWTIHHTIADADTVALYCTHSGRHTGDFFGLAATGPIVRLQADAHDPLGERQGRRTLGRPRRRRPHAPADRTGRESSRLITRAARARARSTPTPTSPALHPRRASVAKAPKPTDDPCDTGPSGPCSSRVVARRSSEPSDRSTASELIARGDALSPDRCHPSARRSPWHRPTAARHAGPRPRGR